VARRVALYSNPVLILGESGTGKELLARAVHAASLRAGKHWEAMNCAAIPRDLLDAELFGHVKGAFTGAVSDRPGRFEACDGGTLFLDEVGEMPPETQVRLLRVLQEGEIQRVGDTKTKKVDVRVIAATNRDLVSAVRAGTFRDDLFYRLAVLVLRIAPLRERPDDIFPLAQHFLSVLNERVASIPGAERKHLSPEARKFAESYPWPGNVRELENTLARIVALVPGDAIRREHFEAHVIPTDTASAAVAPLAARRNFSLIKELEAVERRLIEQALRESGGVKEKAAKLLGMASRQALAHRIRRLGISS
jgi:transcriptional regulator with GAF, ATPase, and Fis domain